MKKLLITLTLSVLLAGCGFQPLHSQSYRAKQSVDLSTLLISVTGSNISNSINATTSTVPRRYGELLKAEIEDSVNPESNRSEKLFDLAIVFTESDLALFVNPDGTASRGNLVYVSDYVITRRSDQQVVATGSLQRTGSYNTSPTADYASYVSIEDARKRAILELAQDYKLRLSTLLPTLNNPTATAIQKPAEDVPALQPVRQYETIRPGY